MKKLLTMLLLSALALGTAHAQKKQPAGMRVEVAESETDHGDYSIFTYKDTDEALTTIDTILGLFDKDLDTMVASDCSSSSLRASVRAAPTSRNPRSRSFA